MLVQVYMLSLCMFFVFFLLILFFLCCLVPQWTVVCGDVARAHLSVVSLQVTDKAKCIMTR